MGSLRLGMIIFAALALVAIGALYVLFETKGHAEHSIVRSHEQNVVEIGRHQQTADLASVFSDVRYLAAKTRLHLWPVSPDPSALATLAEGYRGFVEYKARYDQVRFIDLKGMEKARIERDSSGPKIVAADRLQDKSDRYYVAETLKLDAGQVLVSPFDLNVEYNAIEMPIKPTIRLSTPMFDTEGRKRGIVVLNYLGQQMLAGLRELNRTSSGDLWLLNSDGYWLLGPPADEWAFMYPERNERSFARIYADAWNRMLKGPPSGQLEFEGDLFTYTKVTFDSGQVASSANRDGKPAVALPSWFLLSHVPAATLAAQRWDLARPYLAIAAILMPVLGIAATFIAYQQSGRKLVEARLRASERRLATIAEATPDGVIVSDTGGTILFANAAVEPLFGYRPEDLIGRPVEVLVPQKFRGRHVIHRTHYVMTPKVRPMGGEAGDLYGVRADGTEFPVAIRLGFTQSESGMLVIATARDLTELRQRDQAIVTLNDRLERDNAQLIAVNKELEAFSYSVAHDLRTPLRAIDGFTQVLLEDHSKELDEAGQACAGRIRRAAQHMGTLIDDLLHLARITQSDLSRTTVDLSQMVHRITKTLEDGAPNRAAEFHIADGIKVDGDARLLHIAIENLVNNAWKFTANRSPARLEVGRERINGETAYFVRDNGVGFYMAHAGKLSGAFQRLHSPRDFPGTGIGLATVQRIINKHGGRIWAQAEPEKGATFYFTL